MLLKTPSGKEISGTCLVAIAGKWQTRMSNPSRVASEAAGLAAAPPYGFSIGSSTFSWGLLQKIFSLRRNELTKGNNSFNHMAEVDRVF